MSAADDRELAALRARLDACNARIVAALDERAALVREVARWKRARGLPALDPGREARMAAEVRARASAAGFGPDALARIFEAILAESRAIVCRAHDGDAT